MDTKASAVQVGFSIAAWVAAAGISRADYYTLPPEIKPTTVNIGKRRIVIEAPAAWLHRVAEMQRERQTFETANRVLRFVARWLFLVILSGAKDLLS